MGTEVEIPKLKLFQGLTEDELEQSLRCSMSRVKQYDREDYVFLQGEKPGWIYLILSEAVMLEQVNSAGKQIYTEQKQETQQFGVMDLFLKRGSYTYSARAKTPVKVLEISGHFFYGPCARGCAHHSKILFNILEIFAEEAEENARKVQLLTCGTLRQRIMLYLLQNSPDGRAVHMNMNREELSAYLNAARPSLSRELSQMQTEGMIKMEGRKTIRILDYARLQEDFAGLYSEAE